MDNKEFVNDSLVKEFIEWEFNGKAVGEFLAEWERFKKSKEVKKDYEILKCKCGSSIHNYQPNICLGADANVEKCEVYSVKRLSDNEVFTIGDNVFIEKKDEPTNWVGDITDFWIDGNGKMHICYNGHHYKIKYFKKVVKKEVLFVTQDGKEIFEGDTYWYVSSNDFSYKSSVAPFHGIEKNNFWKTFSTEDAIKEYILMNRPLLSLNDIYSLDYFNYIPTKVVIVDNIKLKDLAKQKLNK